VLFSIARNWFKTLEASNGVEFKGFHGNPYDGQRLLAESFQQDEIKINKEPA
jgi:hypothetical protein